MFIFDFGYSLNSCLLTYVRGAYINTHICNVCPDFCVFLSFAKVFFNSNFVEYATRICFYY